jgi:DNA-binding transcriptional MerR regulator
MGLLDNPGRTSSGYRDYDENAAARLLFIARARKMGLNCEQITDLLPIWGGANCGATHARVSQLLHDKQAEIAARIAELAQFAEQLEAVRATLETSAPPPACRTDLSCCVPESGAARVSIELQPKRERSDEP